MLVGIQMILTILIGALTLGAEMKLQIFIVKLGPAADRTAVPGMLFVSLRCIDLLPVHSLSLDLLGIYPVHVPACQKEDQ